jgi:hypothetical protein
MVASTTAESWCTRILLSRTESRVGQCAGLRQQHAPLGFTQFVIATRFNQESLIRITKRIILKR